ncbi:hypothetical protein ISCGN_009814 [Ixodes scapularis]
MKASTMVKDEASRVNTLEDIVARPDLIPYVIRGSTIENLFVGYEGKFYQGKDFFIVNEFAMMVRRELDPKITRKLHMRGSALFSRNEVGRLRHRTFVSRLTQDENFVVAALFCAIEEGNLTGLEELFSMSSINPNQSNKHGETAVHVASGLAQLPILKFLHSKGANLKLADSHGDSAMYWAARQGHTDVIQYLWEHGVSVDCQNRIGETALHVAARYGHRPAVKLLCSFGANINVADEHGDTALHIAAWHGFPTIMHVLCEAGAHTHLRNKHPCDVTSRSYG